MEKIIINKYHISGMSCGGCVSSVKQKLLGVDGVTGVTIDLGTKEAEITSTKEFEAATLQQAFHNSQFTISAINLN